MTKIKKDEIIKDEIIKKEKIKVKKERESFKSIIKRYTTVFTVLLMVSVLVIFSILWVTETGKDQNISLNILYGNESTLLFGLLFTVLGSLFYSSNLKKFYPIRWIISVSLYFIGIILINSIPVLIIGLVIILLLIAQLLYNLETFKNYFKMIKEKSKIKKAKANELETN